MWSDGWLFVSHGAIVEVNRGRDNVEVGAPTRSGSCQSILLSMNRSNLWELDMAISEKRFELDVSCVPSNGKRRLLMCAARIGAYQEAEGDQDLDQVRIGSRKSWRGMEGGDV